MTEEADYPILLMGGRFPGDFSLLPYISKQKDMRKLDHRTITNIKGHHVLGFEESRVAGDLLFTITPTDTNKNKMGFHNIHKVFTNFAYQKNDDDMSGADVGDEESKRSENTHLLFVSTLKEIVDKCYSDLPESSRRNLTLTLAYEKPSLIEMQMFEYLKSKYESSDKHDGAVKYYEQPVLGSIVSYKITIDSTTVGGGITHKKKSSKAKRPSRKNRKGSKSGK